MTGQRWQGALHQILRTLVWALQEARPYLERAGRRAQAQREHQHWAGGLYTSTKSVQEAGDHRLPDLEVVLFRGGAGTVQG